MSLTELYNELSKIYKNLNVTRELTISNLIQKRDALKNLETQFLEKYDLKSTEYSRANKNADILIDLKNKFVETLDKSLQLIKEKKDKIEQTVKANQTIKEETDEELNSDNNIIVIDDDIDKSILNEDIINTPKVNDKTELKNDTNELESNNGDKMADFNLETALKIIPEFNGEVQKLENFLQIVQFYADTVKAAQTTHIINLVLKTRLGSKVRTKVENEKTPETIADLITLLRKACDSGKNKMTILNELANTKQNKSIKEFAETVEKLISQLNSISCRDKTENEKKTIMNYNDELGLNTFQNGLKEPIKTTIFASRPTKLITAIQLASQIDGSKPNEHQVFNINYRNNRTRGFRGNRGNNRFFNHNNYRANYNNGRYNNNNGRYNNNNNYNNGNNNRNYSNNNNYNNNTNDNNNRNNNFRGNNRGNFRNNRGYNNSGNRQINQIRAYDQGNLMMSPRDQRETEN